MTIGAIPVWGIFVGTILLVMASIELGYRFGLCVRRRSTDERESPSSIVSQSVLALAAFILAFTFGIAANRFEARKQLIREEANAVGTAWLRADFLPVSDRAQSRAIMRAYVDARVDLFHSRFSLTDIPADIVAEIERSHGRLWAIAVENAQKDVSSHVAALYVETLNEVFDIHTLRVAFGPHTHIPTGVWLALFGLVALGMTAAGYQTGITGSKRAKSQPILAVSFAIAITLIAALDRPGGGVIGVSHQPLIDLQDWMSSRAE